MQVESFLAQGARIWPDKIALINGSHRLTYSEVERSCNRLAHGLLTAGIQRGDRVAVYLDNSVEAVIAIFAILKAGAVFMTVNPTTKTKKLAYVLNDSRAKAIILPAHRVAPHGDCWDETDHLKVLITTGAVRPTVLEGTTAKRCFAFDQLVSEDGKLNGPPEKRAIDIDLAALVYTSGSTGSPKGVMLTHLNIVSAATSITTYLENTADDVILNVLPLAFDYGLYQVLMGFKVGATVILERSFAYPHAVMKKLVQERVTGFPLVPTMLAILLQMDLRRYDLSDLRYVTNTGAALPTSHIRRLRELLPHVRVYSMYGLTECKRVSYLPPDQIDARPTSVGRGMPNEEVFLVDESGHRVGPGEIGELVVRGSNVMKGYWERPIESDRVLKPGSLPGEKVLHTGDLFRTDDEGYLYFVGRRDDMIKSRGEKVSPKEVENVLHNHPAIAEAAVVGVPDDVLGQAVYAVVTPAPGFELSQQEVLRHCAAHLEDFMVPKSVEFRDQLPKSGNGKIDKRQLEQDYAGALV